MSWIKRNLFFLIFSVAALVLMGLAGWYLYSKWNLNNDNLAKLNADYEALRALNGQNPHPGNDKVNNIKAAKEQEQQVRDLIAKARSNFGPVPPIPDEPKITDHDFSVALSRTIDQLQKNATNSSVTVPAVYNFSFQAEKPLVQFSAGSLPRLASKLGEVKALCDVLFEAKINALDNIRRERVSSDDVTGPQTDYLSEKSTTNELAVLTPYEITFRCFTPELASVLGGFASAPYGILVKTINVEPAPAAPVVDQPAAPVAGGPVYVQQAAPPPQETTEQMYARRYHINRGEGGGAAPTPAVQYYVVPTRGAGAGASKGALATVLDEKLLKITMNLYLVKLIPPKKAD